MKRAIIVLLGGLLAVAACRKKNTPDQSMADMPGASQAADTSGVHIDRSEAARLGISFARASGRPITTSVRGESELKEGADRRGDVHEPCRCTCCTTSVADVR